MPSLRQRLSMLCIGVERGTCLSLERIRLPHTACSWGGKRASTKPTLGCMFPHWPTCGGCSSPRQSSSLDSHGRPPRDGQRITALRAMSRQYQSNGRPTPTHRLDSSNASRRPGPRLAGKNRIGLFSRVRRSSRRISNRIQAGSMSLGLMMPIL